MSSISRQTRQWRSLSKGLFLLSGYVIGSTVLGLAIAFATIMALYRYRGMVEWRRAVVAATLSLVLMTLCWLTMPANRPPLGQLILRVAMVALLAVGAFVARHVLFGPGPVRSDEILVLFITTAAFAISVWLDRAPRWRRKRARRCAS